MKMRVWTWNIISVTPLVQSSPESMWIEPPAEDGQAKPRGKKRGLVGTESESFALAKRQLYLNKEGKPFHPVSAFLDCLVMACEGRSFGKTPALVAVMQAVSLVDEEFMLYDPATLDAKTPRGLDPTKWQMDKRRGINWNKSVSSGGVAVVCIRPKWKSWGGFLSLNVDMELMSEDHVREGLTGLVNIGGHMFGVGVGRRRIKAVVNRRPVWSLGFGAGKFKAVLRNSS